VSQPEFLELADVPGERALSGRLRVSAVSPGILFHGVLAARSRSTVAV